MPKPLGPKASLPDVESRRNAVDQLVQHVSSRLEYLTSNPDLYVRHFSAMSLARLTRLVRGMAILVDNGVGDVTAVLGRSALETCVLGMFVLYGGEQALDEVRGAHIRSRRLLAEKNPEVPAFREGLELFDGWDGPTDRINWQHLIKERLPELIRTHEGTDAEQFGRMLYDQAYRQGSMVGTHAGVATIGSHHAESSGVLGIREVGHTTDDGSAALIVAGSQLGLLASRVFLTFGLDIEPVISLFERIASSVGDLEYE